MLSGSQRFSLGPSYPLPVTAVNHADMSVSPAQQWFTLTDQGEPKGMRRPRSGMLTEASTQRMPERQVWVVAVESRCVAQYGFHCS